MKHIATLVKHKRGPFLEPQFSVTCPCGFVTDPADIDGARTDAKRHISYIESDRLAKQQAKADTQPIKEKS